MWMTTKALFPELIKVLERRNDVPSQRESDRIRESQIESERVR